METFWYPLIISGDNVGGLIETTKEPLVFLKGTKWASLEIWWEGKTGNSSLQSVCVIDFSHLVRDFQIQNLCTVGLVRIFSLLKIYLRKSNYKKKDLFLAQASKVLVFSPCFHHRGPLAGKNTVFGNRWRNKSTVKEKSWLSTWLDQEAPRIWVKFTPHHWAHL